MQHYLIRRPTAVFPPPYHQTRSNWLVLLSFFFFSFFFFFSYLLVLIQLYCKNWILFCVCVWIMWDIFWEWSKETETKIRHFLISFYFYSNSLIVDFFFGPKIVNIPVWCCLRLFFFFFLKRDLWEPREPFTILRSVRFDCSSHRSLLFSYRAVLEANRIAKMSGSRFFWSDCTVQFGFQNLVEKHTNVLSG